MPPITTPGGAYDFLGGMEPACPVLDRIHSASLPVIVRIAAQIAFKYAMRNTSSTAASKLWRRRSSLVGVALYGIWWHDPLAGPGQQATRR